jgi:hypothetical protein
MNKPSPTIGSRMLDKQRVVLIGLTAVVLIFTGASIGSTRGGPSLGVVAPLIIPALLTWSLLLILLHGGRIVEMLAAFLTPGRLENRSSQSLFATALAWMAVITLAVVMLRSELAQFLANAFRQAAQVFSSTLTAFHLTPQAVVNSTPSMMDAISYYYTILVFSAIIIVSFSLLFRAFHKVYTETRSTATQKEILEEVLMSVQSAQSKLERRQEYHETILECYRQMCKMLSGKGHDIQPAQTAREFAEDVSKKLDLGVDSVKGLTFLFEEARYSNHEIDTEKRLMALNYLDSLERSIVSLGGRR